MKKGGGGARGQEDPREIGDENMNFEGKVEQYRKEIKERVRILDIVPQETLGDLKPMIDHLIDDTMALSEDIKDLMQKTEQNRITNEDIKKDVEKINNEINKLNELMIPANED